MKEENVSRAWGNCPACGYSNFPDEVRCEKCGRKLQSPQRLAGSHSNLTVYRPHNAGSEPRVQALRSDQAAVRAEPQSLQSEITRRQLSNRVRAFRARRLNPNLPLQFEPEPPAPSEEPRPRNNVVEFETGAPLAARPTMPPPAPAPQPPPAPRIARQSPRPIEQPRLDFPSPEPAMESFLALPVAPLGLRLLGHAGDFGLTLAAFLLFLIPLKLLAGPVVLSRFLLAGMAGAYVLLVLLYGFVFLCLAGATPTMRWLGLHVVNFDGVPPPRQQLFCRFLGAIASVGSFFLGFLWAAVDDEKLSWHDRISKTFLTASERRSF